VEEQLKQLNISSRKTQPNDGPVSVIVRDESGRTPYRPDGPPQVRILKRTDQNPGINGFGPQKRPQSVSKPNKTYEERHAEYQEARLRIMGRTEDAEVVESTLSVSAASNLHVSRSSPALSATCIPSTERPQQQPMGNQSSPLIRSPPPILQQQPHQISPRFRPVDHNGIQQAPLFYCPPPSLAPQIVVLAQQPHIRPPQMHQKPLVNYLLPTPPQHQPKPDLVIPRNGVGRVPVVRPLDSSWPHNGNSARPVPLVRSPKGPDGSVGFRSGR
jgi:hypothetical protein